MASGKPQIFIERIVEYFGLTPYFDKIVGIKVENTHADKRALILEALPEGMDPHSAVMVGDRRFDMEAARALGLHAVGALYGYGTREELLRARAGLRSPITSKCSGASCCPARLAQRGLFITFEGTDGCGKSTQMKLLAELSEPSAATRFVRTREPGGCPVSERIRDAGAGRCRQPRGMRHDRRMRGAAVRRFSRAEHVRTT